MNKAETMGLRRPIRRFLEPCRTKYSLWRSGLPIPIRKAIEFVLKEHLSYLKLQPLMELAAGVAEIEKESVPGIFIETGCALGGSGIVIASAKKTSVPLRIFDTFGLIPSPSANDGQDVHDRYSVIQSGQSNGIGGKKYYGYIQDLQQRVESNFMAAGWPVERNAVALVKGLYQDTLKIEDPVAFAHIDCDWYESVKTCLDRISPRLSPGGLLIIDDYYSYSGCKKAVDGFLEENEGMFTATFKSRLHLRKRGVDR